MLSENIAALADHLRRYADSGVEMDAVAVTSIVAILDACAEDAAALERAVAPPTARLTGHDLPANVVAIATRLHRQGVTVGMPSPAGGGGAA